jgi:AAA lid domain
LGQEAEEKARVVIRELSDHRDERFGNAREIRSLYERTLELQARRLAQNDTANPAELLTEDIAAGRQSGEGTEMGSEGGM